MEHMHGFVDIYCERLGPGFLAEPLNLVSNAAFILGALYVWPKVKHDAAAATLTVILFIIGIGSALFHSFATRWASVADVLPIAGFILVYLFFATRRLLRWPGPVGLIAVLLFFPYAAYAVEGLRALALPLNGSEPYVAVAILIYLYAVFALFRDRAIAGGLAAGATVLVISIGFRASDMAICEGFPWGVHYVWHVLNGALLAGLILVMARMRRY